MIYYDECSDVDPEVFTSLELPKVESIVFRSTPPSEHNAFSELASEETPDAK